MANFGIGLGAFMGGFTQGAQAAQSIKRGNQQERITDMQLKNMEEEQKMRQGARDLSNQGVQAAQAGTDGQTDNVMNYYMQNTAPKLQQYWMSNGEVDKANAFGKWIQDANVQQGMRYGAGMMRAAQLGDADGVADNMVKLYNQPGYFEDGTSAVSATVRRDDKGNAAGMDIVLRDDKTGKEKKHTFDSMEDVYKTAMQFGSPDQVFKYGMDQLAAGQKAQVDLAKEARGLQVDNLKADRDQNYKLEGQNNQAQLDMAKEAAKNKDGRGSNVSRDAQARISLLKEAGWDDEKINAIMPSIIGVENKSRPMSSRMDDYIKVQSETNRSFRSLSQAEQMKQAQDYIAAQDKITGEGQQQGLTTQTGQGAQQQRLVPMYDTKTGQTVTRPY